MDLDGSADILMQDGDVIASTESYGRGLTQVIVDSSIKPERDDSDPLSREPKPLRRPSEPPLKGKGVTREADVFDHHLTKRRDGPRPAKFHNLPHSTLQSGLVYDVRMRFHVEAVPTEDDVHPEDPRRIHAIFESFVEAGLAWGDETNGPSNDYYMGRIDARKVTKEEVCLVHTEQHYNWIQSIVEMSDDDYVEPEQHAGHRMDSIYLSRMTPYCAALSAGGAIEACRAVMDRLVTMPSEKMRKGSASSTT